jgi:hypothetical protein
MSLELNRGTLTGENGMMRHHIHLRGVLRLARALSSCLFLIMSPEF